MAQVARLRGLRYPCAENLAGQIPPDEQLTHDRHFLPALAVMLVAAQKLAVALTVALTDLLVSRLAGCLLVGAQLPRAGRHPAHAAGEANHIPNGHGGVRDDLRGYVAAALGSPDGVLIGDDRRMFTVLCGPLWPGRFQVSRLQGPGCGGPPRPRGRAT